MKEYNNISVDKTDRKRELIRELVELSNSDKKEWVAGQDLVQYAGTYFSNEEFEKAIESLLHGWLALGGERTEI